MLRALLCWLRRALSRLAARRLLAQRLPRGLREQRLALRAGPREPPPGEFWTAGRRPAPLLRLRALRPAVPLAVLDPGRFRLDPATCEPANERILRLEGQAPAPVLPALRRRLLDLPWMARNRVGFLGPTQAEWFAMWWQQSVGAVLGPGEPDEWERPDEVDWAIAECREQMLIRRDVVKDEQPPQAAEPTIPEIGHPVLAWTPSPLPDAVPEKEWVEPADPRALAPPPPVARAHRDAYLRWRTLIDALAE